MTLWQGKVIYNDVRIASQPDEVTTSRIAEYDLATEQETVLIEARPPHTSAYVLHRSGDRLFYCESGPGAAGLAAQHLARRYDCYVLNLRSGTSQPLAMLQGSCRSAPSPPDISGSVSDDGSLAYIAANTSSGECRDQLRLYDLETGEDRLLLEAESADTDLDRPLLYGNKVIYYQARQGADDIYSLDLETGERVNLSNSGSASQPALWGDYLMWIDEPVLNPQAHGSGEVYILNIETSQSKRLTDDPTYMHLYSSPMAGDGFFVWADAHEVKDSLPVCFPETGELVYLEGPGGGPTVSNGSPDGNTLFWSWAGWSGVSTIGPGRALINREQVEDRPWRVFMTTFE